MSSRRKSGLAVLFTLSITAYGGTAAAQGAAACNRACLIDLAKAYVAAVAAHNVAAAPLASNVAFVENVTRLKPGEGLWASATSAPKGFAIYVPDVDQQQAGFLGVMERKGQNGTEPVMVAMRLKLEGGKIAEAEHIVAGLNAANMARMQTPRPGLLSEVPAANRKSHAELVRIGLSYYDALDDNDGTLMPFADDCQRHENGMITAGPEAGAGPNADPNRAPVAKLCGPQLSSKTFTYIDRIENRRLIAADPVTGLSMGFSHFRHPMTNLPYNVIHTDGSTSERNSENFKFNPFDMPAAHIFKIGADGKVHEIEAVGFVAPYNSPTGWEK
ncbi:MAG TPA: hypothetical protein VNP02_07650 [Gammaproteobacteria bacterium]|nr:hypothetical protein [Gammaproteobacteria bacterium]